MNDSEKNPKSHWDQLAAEIGADVSKEEKSLVSRPASPVVPHRKPKSSPPPERAPSDWNALAAELGATPAPSEPPDHRRGRPGSDKPSDSADDTPRDSSEAADIVEPDRLESEVDRGVAQDSTAKKRGSRRRRPRRSRSKTSSKEAETAEQSVLEEAEEEIGETFEPDSNGTTADGDEKEAPSDERRRRRRRRRRPAKKTESAEPTNDAAEPVRQPSDADADNRSHRTSDDDRDERKSRPTRAGHKNIPTWHEAINMIVETNIELHKSQPARSGSGSQRGRGRGRGGRPRGRKKT